MENEKKSRNYFWKLFILIIPFINWIILLLEDYTEEKIVKSYSLWGEIIEYENISIYIKIINVVTKYLIIFLPIVVGIIWYVFIKNKKVKFKNGMLICFAWIIVNILFFMLFNTVNVIPQNKYVFLNGIEYIIFPIWWTIVPLLVLIVLKIINYIYVEIKK